MLNVFLVAMVTVSSISKRGT